MTRQEIAATIKARRNELQISQSDLSIKTGITREYFPAIESGSQNITVDKLITICNALDLHITINNKA